MSKINSFGLNEPQYTADEEGRMLFQKYNTLLPDEIAGTTACVAVQLATPLSEQLYSYIQLGRILIDEGLAGVDAVEADKNSFSILNGCLTVGEEFSKASIYSLNGMKVMDIRNASTSLNGMKGIYILVIDGKSHKIVVR